MGTWNNSYEASPSGSNTFGQVDDIFRDLKTTTRTILAHEHDFDLADTGNQGAHLAGSAKAYYGGNAPTDRPGGWKALDAEDAGRSWHDTEGDGVLKVYSGSAWILAQVLPVGTVLMFDGSFTNNVTMPGWYICDGNNGTPNLVAKFIRGAATSGDTGGADSVTMTANMLVAHSHALSEANAGLTLDNAGSHYHLLAYNHNEDSTVAPTSSNYLAIIYQPGLIGGPGAYFPPGVASPPNAGRSSTTPDHTHTLTVDGATDASADATEDIPTVPSYYAVVFIKRMS